MTESEWLTSEDPSAMLSWLSNPAPILPGDSWAPPRASDRKLRLWVEACRATAAVKDKKWKWDLANKVELGHVVADWSKMDAYQRALPMSARAALLREIVDNPFRPVTLPKGPALRCKRCEGDGWNPSDDGWGARDKCKVCDGKGTLNLFGPCPWLTPTVLSLAEAAYRDRSALKCRWCRGTGDYEGRTFGGRKACPDCRGTGTIADGTLDPLTLLALADALEEAGCAGETRKCESCGGTGYGLGCAGDRGNPPCGFCHGEKKITYTHPILTHLRNGGVHVRGCWATDLILGRD